MALLRPLHSPARRIAISIHRPRPSIATFAACFSSPFNETHDNQRIPVDNRQPSARRRHPSQDAMAPEFLVEPFSSHGEAIGKEAERICRILSGNPTSMAAASLDKAGIAISPELVSEVLKKLSNGGMLALVFFRWAEKREGFKYEAESFRHLIEALGKIKQFQIVWSLVDFMKSRGFLTKEVFGLIARRYARARKIEDAVKVLEKMETYGLTPDLSDFNCFLDTISKSKHVRRAQELFDEMTRKKRFSPDLKTFTILLEGWGFERDLPMMYSVHEQMKAAGFQPDVVAFGIIINALCKSRKYDDALKLFDKMSESNMKPSPHIYCTLINGLGSDKRLDEALRLFRQSKDAGFPPEAPTYNAVVGSYCWVMRFDDAFGMIEEMKACGIGPNARTYDIILHHLIKARRPEDAYRTFCVMNGEPGCEPELNTYTMMVNMFCKEERVDMALKVWKQMEERGILPCMHLFSVLVNGLCYENRLDEACRVFQEMLDNGIRPAGQLYSNLKDALIEGGKRDLAVELGMKLEKLRRTPLSA